MARLLAPLLLALLALVAPLEQLPTIQAPAAAAPAASGRLLLPRAVGVHVLDLASGSARPLISTPQVVLGAAWAPDESRVAFVQFAQAIGDRFGGTDLYLFEGGQSRVLVPHNPPDQVLSSPAWTPDGRSLLYQVAGPASNGFGIEQVALASGEHRILEQGVIGPTVSPDGRLLAYVRLTTYDALIVRPLAGGAERELLPADAFIALSGPRFSPDGQRLAFLAIGGPSSGRPPRVAAALLAWPGLGSSVALAHGLPWDPWVVNLDGSGLRQVSDLASDDPTLAWSPDGSMLAVLGGDGLWLMPLDGSASPTLLDYGSYGALDWRP